MKAPIIKQNPQGADAAVVATQLGGTPGANGAIRLPVQNPL